MCVAGISFGAETDKKNLEGNKNHNDKGIPSFHKQHNSDIEEETVSIKDNEGINDLKDNSFDKPKSVDVPSVSDFKGSEEAEVLKSFIKKQLQKMVDKVPENMLLEGEGDMEIDSLDSNDLTSSSKFLEEEPLDKSSNKQSVELSPKEKEGKSRFK